MEFYKLDRQKNTIGSAKISYRSNREMNGTRMDATRRVGMQVPEANSAVGGASSIKSVGYFDAHCILEPNWLRQRYRWRTELYSSTFSSKVFTFSFKSYNKLSRLKVRQVRP